MKEFCRFVLLGCLALLLVGTEAFAQKKKKKKESIPVAGQTFRTGPGAIKYVHVIHRFVDSTDDRWPCIGWGRAVEGTTVAFDDEEKPQGSITIRSEGINLLKGEVSRFILGDIIQNHEAPEVTFEVTGFGAEIKQMEVPGKKGQMKKKNYVDFKGKVTVAGKSADLKNGRVTYGIGRTDGHPNMRMYFRSEVDGVDIGLTSQADKKVVVRFDISLKGE